MIERAKIIYFLYILCIVRLAAIHAMNWNVWIANLVKTAGAVVMMKLRAMILRKMNRY